SPRSTQSTAPADRTTARAVTFTGSGAPRAAEPLATRRSPDLTVQSGIAFPQQPVIQLQDAAGNPVSQSGTAVTAAIATGGGTLGRGATETTTASATATLTTLVVSSLVGRRTLGFAAPGLTGVR